MILTIAYRKKIPPIRFRPKKVWDHVANKREGKRLARLLYKEVPSGTLGGMLSELDRLRKTNKT